MEIRSVGSDLFMGQMEEQTEGKGNMMNFKANYSNFSNAIVREEYHICHDVGVCLPCIIRQTSNFKPQ